MPDSTFVPMTPATWQPPTYQPYAMNYNAPPAYTTVSARRALIPEPVMQQQPPLPPPPHKPAKKVEWSSQVREYVQRCFAVETQIPGIERTEMEARLKSTLTDAADKNILGQIDWTTYPLPQQMIQADRQLANMTPNGSKKRKPDDVEMSEAADGTTPPWRKTAKPNTFEDRISYANQAQADRLDKKTRKRHEALRAQNESKYNADLEKRKQRFEAGKPGNLSPTRPWTSSRSGSPPPSANAGPVVGTSQDIEKRYFRLTAPPKPETVRPLPVLEKTLDHLKRKWKAENNYVFICDQFKSLRQDLTVQHIKNEFTVNVYEIHARIALEKGDLGEYNQCQTQLRALYKQNLGGHPGEFTAYRILYFIHTCNRTDMNDVLADLTAADKKQPAVKHALAVRSALALGNYHRFFRLYLDTPNMGGYLMDMFVGRERLAALANICKAYKPDVRISFLAEELGFEGYQDCVQFLVDHNGQQLITQSDDEVLKFASGKANALFETARADAFRKVDIKGQI